MKLLLTALLAAASCAAHTPTVKSALKDGPGGFVFNPLMLGANATLQSAGGLSQPRQLEQWPQLMVGDISQTFFRLQPCALRPPHVHPFASGLLYLIEGGNFSVGFVTEDGTPVVNTITTGASALFPVGLIHYQQNLDCKEAVYTISYNKAMPGTQVTLTTLFKLPASTVAPILGLNGTAFDQMLAASKVKDKFVTATDPDCVARCQVSASSTPSQAPSMAPSNAAGR